MVFYLLAPFNEIEIYTILEALYIELIFLYVCLHSSFGLR
jgi:hypothetical protein